MFSESQNLNLKLLRGNNVFMVFDRRRPNNVFRTIVRAGSAAFYYCVFKSIAMDFLGPRS